jgi:uncharacterized membrane protein
VILNRGKCDTPVQSPAEKSLIEKNLTKVDIANIKARKKTDDGFKYLRTYFGAALFKAKTGLPPEK